MADNYTRKVHNAIFGLTPTYTLYPAVAAGTVAGTVVTSGAGAWGADKELIAAAGIATEYWVCAFDLDTAGAAQGYVIDIEVAGTTHVTSFRFDVTAVTANLSRFPAAPFPIYVVASSQLTARAAGVAAKVIGVSTLVATGY